MKPAREHATNNAQTYLVTSETWERRALFRAEPWARLFFKTLLSYRGESYHLHEFLLMPDHFHLLITPISALEWAVQLIKGGFSHRVRKELGSNAEIWQRGFADHRIRGAEDYNMHRHYMYLNPVKIHLCVNPADYQYSSAFPGWKVDPIPQGLKPAIIEGRAYGTAEAVPFQNTIAGLKLTGLDGTACGTAEAVLLQSSNHCDFNEMDGHSVNLTRGIAQTSGAAAESGEKR